MSSNKYTTPPPNRLAISFECTVAKLRKPKLAEEIGEIPNKTRRRREFSTKTSQDANHILYIHTYAALTDVLACMRRGVAIP